MGATVRAKNLLEREKAYTPQEAAEYLKNRENFRFVSETLKELLAQRNLLGDDAQNIANLRKLTRDKGVAPKKISSVDKWLADKVFPSKEFAIKLCFAFELSGRTKPTALEFLWNTCQVNGFNFRCADEVVYFYALERGEPFSYATKLIERYEKYPFDKAMMDSSETRSTSALWDIFSQLDIMPEDEFFETLCENKAHFSGFRKTAHREFVKIYDSLIALLENSSTDDNNRRNEQTTTVRSTIIFDETLQSIATIRGAKNSRTVLTDISKNFPLGEYLRKLYAGKTNENPQNNDFIGEYGFARKAFILCFFAKYVIEWERYLRDIGIDAESPKKFFTDFYRRLNSLLNKCTYGLLYPRNPYDWLILNCVRSLDSLNDDMDALDLFNETLIVLTAEHEE